MEVVDGFQNVVYARSKIDNWVGRVGCLVHEVEKLLLFLGFTRKHCWMLLAGQVLGDLVWSGLDILILR